MCNRYRIRSDQVAWAQAMGIEIIGEYDELPLPEIFPERLGWLPGKADSAGLALPR